MSNAAIVQQYRKILRTMPLDVAMREILAHVNTLVWKRPGQPDLPLTRQEKNRIIEEIFDDRTFIKSVPGLESDRVYGSINEADNSGILDVISALKRGVKD